MNPRSPARMLRIHVSESDRFQGKSLYEAIVARCREHGIAGATVFRGLEGYGDSAELHRAHLLRHDQPMVVTIVDQPEKIDSIQPELEVMLDTGMVSVSNVEMIRVQKLTEA